MSPGELVRNVSAVILAGGKSSRMGRPKSLLPFDGEPLIAHILRKLKNEFAEVIVVAEPNQELPPPLPVKLIRDELPFQGPVGGMYYGLRATSAEIGFVTSCDAPFLNARLIESIVALGDADVAVPFWEGRLQPLHAAYRRTAISCLKQQLDDGVLRPTSLYEKVTTRIVSEQEVRQIDPEELSFINLNTPDEYQRALRRWRMR